MRTIPMVLRARATGPAALRHRLRAIRSQLERTAGAARAVDRLATGIPAAVFGGSLLGSLSDCLGRALREPEESGSITSRRPSSSPVETTALSPDRPRALTPMSRRARVEQTVQPPAMAGAKRRAPFEVGGEVSRTRETFQPLAGPAEPAGRATVVADEPSGRSARGRLMTDSLAARTSRRPPGIDAVPGSPLVQRLAEYAELSRAHARHQLQPDADVKARPPRTDVPLPASDRLPVAWPSQDPGATAESLLRFSGAGSDAAVPGHSWAARPVAPSIAISPRVVDAQPGAGQTSLRELSERMADVLRQQARRHGIDLT